MRTFVATLRGRNEAPPVRTLSTGFARLRLNAGGNRLLFTLVVRNISCMTQAHIHLGRRGENGPVVAFLFGPSNFGVSTAKGVIRGSLSNAGLIGPLKGRTLAELIREIERGNAYVNVHTIQNSNGEIRGQLKRA